MKFPKFGKSEYRSPQVSAVPPGQEANQGGTFINEAQRQILIKIIDGGQREDLAIALVVLTIASDIVKQKLTEWHM